MERKMIINWQLVKQCFAIFGCMLIQLTLGSRYTLTNFSPYIISYIRERTDDVSVRNVDILWVATSGLLGRCVGMTLGGILDRRFEPRTAVAIGSFIFVTSFFLCYCAVKDSFLAFLFTYGGYGSFGMMISYGVTIQTAIKWMNKRPAFAAGIVMMGLGASALIFNQVITLYINPDNLKPNISTTENNEGYFLDDDLLDRVPCCFLLLGGIFTGMMFMGLLCLFPGSPSGHDTSEEIVPVENGSTEMKGKVAAIKKPPNEKSPNVKDEKMSGEQQNSETILIVKQAILLAFKTRGFYILWLTVFFVDAGVHFAIGMNKAYGQTFIQDDHFLALFGSVGSIFNCIMRPVWGLILDRFGFKVTVRAMTLGVSLTVGTIVLTEHLHKLFYMIWTATLFAMFCGITTLGPATLSKLFRPQNMAVNYGFIMSAVGCSTIVGGVTGTTLKETLGWHNMFYLSAGMIFFQLVSACENGWTPDPPRRACFKLYNDIRLDWADAKSYCARNGAYLTDMSGFSEQKFINDSVLKDVHIDYGVWLGATDKGWGAKPWKWVNGNKMNIDLFLWRKGNPDNGEVIIETPFKGENCLQMTTESGYRGQLNDYYCKQKLPFVCKNKQMYTVTTTPLIARTTTQQTSRKNSLPEKSGNSEAAVIVISLLASLLLIAVAVTVILILKRRRKNPTMTILYEDTANLSPDEHLYTGLAGTSAVDNGASSAERPPIRTPSANQPLQGHYSEPYLYDRPIENSVSGSQWIGQNNTSLKPEKCRPYEQMDCSKSVDGNPSKPEVKKRHNKGVKGQQLMTSPSGYIDMDRHYEEIVDDHVTSSDPDSRRVKGSLVEKGNGKEANNVNNCEHPPYYLTPKSEA